MATKQGFYSRVHLYDDLTISIFHFPFPVSILTVSNYSKQTQVGCNLLKPVTQAQFATPLNEHHMDQLRKSAVPEKTRAQTEWGVRVWQDWVLARNCNNSDVVPSEFVVAAQQSYIDSFMCYFVTEAQRQDGQLYSPLSLNQLCCSLQRDARFDGFAITVSPLKIRHTFKSIIFASPNFGL